MNSNPLARFVSGQGLIILDGGLATALETHGHDLNDSLWSAKLLIEAPDAIRDQHTAYLKAGADCISTATYQASLPGFRARGLNDEQSLELMKLAVDLAVEARATFWADPENQKNRQYPLVAASIGPYGAYLADGSEYRGNYDATDAQLAEFHRSRWQVLSSSKADLLACETLPSGREAEILLQILREQKDCWAWLSFSCSDGENLCDGTPLKEIVQACHEVPNVAAVGINCTAPGHLPSLIAMAREATDKMILAYPNLGERYDPVTKTWGTEPSDDRWLESADEWVRLGVSGVGGCCRIGPAMISELRRRILK
jgi:homocysteine S-methyltransferase